MNAARRQHSMCFLVGISPLVIMVLVGCGLSSEPIAVVKCKVTIDGQTAKDGTISFVPAGQKYPTARGEIVGGQFELSVPSGTYKVMISSQRVLGETKIYDTPDSPTRKTTEEILPPRYNDQTELQIEVGTVERECDFDLSSK